MQRRHQQDVQVFSAPLAIPCSKYNERQAARYAGLMFEEFGEFVAEPIIPGCLKNSGHWQRLRPARWTTPSERRSPTKAVTKAADNVGGDWLHRVDGLLHRPRAQQLAIANLGKIGDDGVVLRDANGKIQKPEGWKPADMSELEIVTAESHLKAA